MATKEACAKDKDEEHISSEKLVRSNIELSP